jgi:hypothetical protein
MCVGFKIVTAVTIKSAAFLRLSTLKIEAMCSYET